MKRCTSRVWCSLVSLTLRTTWCLLWAMPTTKKPTKVIAPSRCPPCAIFTAAIGNVADRRMLWISMICCFILSCFSATIRMCLPAISRSFAIFWWMSIRTPTLPNTVLCFSWRKSISTSVWWVMMRKVFILSGGRILITFCILQRYIRVRKFLSWNKITVPPKRLFLQPTV